MSQPSFLERYTPTLHAYLEKRRAAKRNRLPVHLRPKSKTPIYIQIVLNLGIAYTLINLMWNRDDVFSEGKAAAAIAVCMFLLISTLVQAVRLKRRFKGIPGQKLAAVNFWLMVIAFLCLPTTIAVFMN